MNQTTITLNTIKENLTLPYRFTILKSTPSSVTIQTPHKAIKPIQPIYHNLSLKPSPLGFWYFTHSTQSKLNTPTKTLKYYYL